MARGAGVKGFGVERRSTGLAGGPVPTSFGCVSDDRGFCGEQGMRWASWDTPACSQGPQVCSGWAVGVLAQRGAMMPWSSITLTWAGQAHLWRQGPWDRTQGLLLECHSLQGHLPGLERGGGDQAGPCSGDSHITPLALTSSTACLWMKACCRANVEESRPGTTGVGSEGTDPKVQEMREMGIPYHAPSTVILPPTCPWLPPF